jgi:hypothetical protein
MHTTSRTGYSLIHQGKETCLYTLCIAYLHTVTGLIKGAERRYHVRAYKLITSSNRTGHAKPNTESWHWASCVPEYDQLGAINYTNNGTHEVWCSDKWSEYLYKCSAMQLAWCLSSTSTQCGALTIYSVKFRSSRCAADIDQPPCLGQPLLMSLSA